MITTIDRQNHRRSFPQGGVALVFGVSLLMLALELILPNFFLLRFRFEGVSALLIIAVTMLGIAVGGLVVFGLSRTRLVYPGVGCALISLPAAILLAFWALARVDDPAWAVACLVVPFASMGIILAPFFMDASTPRIYAVNLAGSAAGVAAAVLLLTPLGGEQSLILLSVGAAIMALWWTYRTRAGIAVRVTAVSMIVLSGGVAAYQGTTRNLDIFHIMDLSFLERWPNPAYLVPTALATPGARHLASRWDLVSRVDAIRLPAFDPHEVFLPRELSTAPPSPIRREYEEFVRGDVALYHNGSLLTLIPDQAESFAATGPYAILDAPRVLILGVGGGVDIAKARYAHASRIVAVEINPGLVDLMRTELAGYDQGQYDAAEVHVMDGRTFAHLSNEIFDLIMVSFADYYMSFATTDVALENYLYTVDAFEDYFARLAPGGMVNIQKFLASETGQFELLRILANVLVYFENTGVADPAQHIFITGYPTSYYQSDELRPECGNLLIKKTPFTEEEVARMAALVEPPFRVIHAPGRPVEENPYRNLIFASSRDDFFADFPYDVRPVTDDRPFLYLFDKGMHIHKGVLATFLKILTLAVVIPAGVLLVGTAPVRSPRIISGVIYFAAIAVAFMAIEGVLVSQVRLFVGSPIPSLVVVLTTLLLGAGLGSRLSGAVTPRVRWGALVLLPAVVVIVPTTIAWAQEVFAARTLGGRAVVAGLVIFPVAVLMGTPFPTMLERLRTMLSPRSAPLLVAVNGAFSALAIVLVMFYAPRTGLTVWIYCAAGLYVFAAVLYSWDAKREEKGQDLAREAAHEEPLGQIEGVIRPLDE